MANIKWAKLGYNNKVISVAVVNEDNCKDANNSFNEEIGRQHLEDITNYPNWISENKSNNKPSIGNKYDEDKNCFHTTKPFPSWVWDEDNYCWKAPVARTEDDNTNANDHWNESTQAWQDSPVE
tara:strand:- start:318 stop:689 length:372 start_codon:yes stop_codon:yes gene_type:complete